MTPVVALGAGAGLALWLTLTALIPAQPPLERSFAALNTTAPPAPPGLPQTGKALPGWLAYTWRPMLMTLRRGGFPRASTLRDLALLDRDPAVHLSKQFTGALIGGLAPTLAAGVAAVASGALSWAVPVWVGVLGAVFGASIPQVALRSLAAQRRVELRHALSALLDSVVIAISGGAGVEQSLIDASRPRLGASWAMRRLRAAIDAAAFAQVPPWRTLARLGADTGVSQLQDLAAAVLLAGGEGARVRATLTARAATLRARQAAELKAQARAANQRMILPLMLMGLGYLIFLLYPAIEAVKAAF